MKQFNVVGGRQQRESEEEGGRRENSSKRRESIRADSDGSCRAAARHFSTKISWLNLPKLQLDSATLFISY